MSDSKEIQVFKSIDLISVFLHLSLTLTVFSLVGWGHFVQGKRDQARLRAESIGMQVSAIKSQINTENQGGRGIASAQPESYPVLGKDPWGNSYKIKQDPTNSRRLLIWSLGPNGKDETSSALLDSAVEVQFKGDDLGSIVSL